MERQSIIFEFQCSSAQTGYPVQITQYEDERFEIAKNMSFENIFFDKLFRLFLRLLPLCCQSWLAVFDKDFLCRRIIFFGNGFRLLFLGVTLLNFGGQ